jgi:hypothetical protein
MEFAMRIHSLVAIVALALPTVGAAAVDCVGKVQKVLLYADGSLNVMGAWRGDYTYVCNTNGSFGGVPSEVCLGWYALLSKAKADNLDVTIYYFTNTPCNALPTYQAAPVPVYVGLW